MDSPRERISQHDGVPQNPEMHVHPSENQMDQIGSEPARDEIRETTLEDNISPLNSH